MHMGCENMGPSLYTFVRFLKPTQILEIGAGYTSIFLLQALADNRFELEKFTELRKEGECSSFVVDPFLEKGEVGYLHCVDNMAHAQTTAMEVRRIAEELNIQKHLNLVVADAWGLAKDWPEKDMVDMLWLDFGAGKRLQEFLDVWWPKLQPGGMCVVHSTLTNSFTRPWLDSVRNNTGADGPLGECAVLSFREPHKQFQNSFTVIQKRGPGLEEPIYSMYP
jgi:hypothetical protein